MQFFNALLDLVFPPRCETCRTIGPEAFCSRCQKQISYLSPSAFTHAVGVYDGPLKKAILNLKFKKKRHLAGPLGSILSKYLLNHLDMTAVDMIVPVPLHERRLRERGFNQAELLAHELTKSFDVPTVSGLLYRTRHTHAQFDLPRAERLRNVHGAFEVKGSNLLKKKNVLLLDDIYTTGATVSECTRLLKAAGANQVHVLTLSRAIM